MSAFSVCCQAVIFNTGMNANDIVYVCNCMSRVECQLLFYPFHGSQLSLMKER